MRNAATCPPHTLKAFVISLIAVAKRLRKHLERGRIYFGLVRFEGEGWWLEQVAAGHVRPSAVRKQREMRVDARFASSFLFGLECQPAAWYHPHLG